MDDSEFLYKMSVQQIMKADVPEDVKTLVRMADQYFKDGKFEVSQLLSVCATAIVFPELGKLVSLAIQPVMAMLAMDIENEIDKRARDN